ncbi:MAG: NCS2 family permease [Bdellovibrionales bacterium]|nr:NCS2 family permease [Bdellovibrionales bacterium]
MKWLDQFFEITKNGSSFTQEARAGLTTFLAMAYIIQVHPAILSETGMPFSSLVTSTVLVCFFSSLAMALYAKNPLVMAPGLGINSFFTFTMVLQMGIPVEKALGATFWAGVIFSILSIFKVREKIVMSVPNHLKKSLAGGIGLLIAYIGFLEGSFITLSSGRLQQAPWNLNNIIFIVSLLIVSILIIRKIKGAFLISILITTLICYVGSIFTGAELIQYKGIFALPDFSLIGKLDLLGSLHLSVLPSIFALAFVDLFESLGTYMALLNRFDLTEPVPQASNSAHSTQPRRLKESLICDALGTTFAGIVGSSSATAYLESGAGLQEGGRTGLTALITALLFLPFMFLSPLLSMIPPVATASILVIVGALMLDSMMDISWRKLDEAIPSFLVLFLIPFTISITNGLIWGFLSHTCIQIFMGRKISIALYVISGCCVLSLILNHFILV